MELGVLVCFGCCERRDGSADLGLVFVFVIDVVHTRADGSLFVDEQKRGKVSSVADFLSFNQEEKK